MVYTGSNISFRAFLSILCAPISLPLFLRFVLRTSYTVYISPFNVYMYMYVCVYIFSQWYVFRLSPFLSRFHNSLSDSSYFLERKTCTRVGHSVSVSIVFLRVFSFDIYLSFVRLYFTFLAHHHHHREVAAFPLIFCYWMLDAKTDI